MAKAAADFPTLQTRRLRLRHFELRDAPGLHTCFGDADAMRFWNIPPSKSITETEKHLIGLRKTTSHYSYLAWAICTKSNDQCIGMINYHHREQRNRRLELGYIVAPSHQRKGLGTEAVAAVLKYCFKQLSAHRIEALIHPDNIGSIRVVEKLGFRCEGGPLIDYWNVGDKYLSAMIYAHINPTK
ncbi:MAG: GNAT family N-acetyltransferase [Hyphomicrobiaceae bacterium]|nr:GNAT family N-acetyltransferase [Hyphomicrobiaceae bacterium]